MIDLAINVTQEKNWQVITLKGELDDHQCPKLNHTLNKLIEDNGYSQLILDLSCVTFIDSVGLGTIAIAGKKLSSIQNGQLKLISNQHKISKMIEISGIVNASNQIIQLFDSLDLAVV